MGYGVWGNGVGGCGDGIMLLVGKREGRSWG